MPTIKTVKPAGGGDYTTLAAWETFAAAQATADQWAECYAGNAGKVSVAGWTATPDAATYPKIYAATGNKHNNISATSGAYLTADGSAGAGIDAQVAYMRIEDIAVSNTSGSQACISCAAHITIDGCLTVNGASGIPAIMVGTATLIRNTIARAANNAIGSWSAGQSYTVENCTAKTTSATDPAVFTISGSGTTTLKNVVAVGTVCFGLAGTKTLSNCASTDATADDYGGSGHLINQTATDLFTDPAGNDFTPKAGSALINAGLDLSASFTTDILGNPRPSGAAWDIGAFEVQQAAAGGGGQRSSACISPFHFPGPGL